MESMQKKLQQVLHGICKNFIVTIFILALNAYFPNILDRRFNLRDTGMITFFEVTYKNNLELSVSFKTGVTSTPYTELQHSAGWGLMIKCNLILIIQYNDFQFDLKTRGYHFEGSNRT